MLMPFKKPTQKNTKTGYQKAKIPPHFPFPPVIALSVRENPPRARSSVSPPLPGQHHPCLVVAPLRLIHPHRPLQLLQAAPVPVGVRQSGVLSSSLQISLLSLGLSLLGGSGGGAVG